MKNHIKPELGSFEVHQIDLFRMQKFFNGLAKKGLCLETIKHIKQILNQRAFQANIIFLKSMNENLGTVINMVR